MGNSLHTAVTSDGEVVPFNQKQSITVYEDATTEEIYIERYGKHCTCMKVGSGSATESIQLITRKNFRKFSMRCRKKKLNDCDTSKFYNKMGHFQKILTLLGLNYKTFDAPFLVQHKALALTLMDL